MNHEDFLALKKQMNAALNLETLKSIAVEIGMNHEDLGGQGLGGKVRELLGACKRRSRLTELAKALSKHVPSVDWSHWGGAMPTEDINAVLRQWLSSALSTSEVGTMVFDLAPHLYGESQATKSKAATLEMAIEWAASSNNLLALIEWGRSNNPYQYTKYFQRIDVALVAHQSKETWPPVVVTNSKSHDAPVSPVIILALRQYARGNWDDGQLAKDTLKMIGVNI